MHTDRIICTVSNQLTESECLYSQVVYSALLVLYIAEALGSILYQHGLSAVPYPLFSLIKKLDQVSSQLMRMKCVLNKCTSGLRSCRSNQDRICCHKINQYFSVYCKINNYSSVYNKINNCFSIYCKINYYYKINQYFSIYP